MLLTHPHRSLWRLAGPIMISNITVALLGIVDTAVVGHLDHSYYLGGVTLAMVIFHFLYFGLSFLRMGTTGMVAQVYGAEDYDAIRTSLAQAMFFALFLSVSVLCLQKLIALMGFSILTGSDDVKEYAQIYYSWAIWAVPAVLFNQVLIGWLLGMHNARATLIMAVFINLINILLDILFVIVFNLDVRGVALATVIAQFSGLLLAIFLCHGVLNRHPGLWQKKLILNLTNFKKMLLLNHNLFLRTISLLLVFAFFTQQGAKQGDDILAANAILMNFYMLMALGLDGFATASEALVGKAIGARDKPAFRQSVKTALQWAMIFSLGFSLLYFIFGQLLINVMTDLETIRTLANEFLIWIMIAPIIAVWCFVWDGIFIGATRGREMRNSMFFSTFMVFLPAWYLLQGYGNHGLWLAMLLFLAARSISMSLLAYRIETNEGFVKYV